MPVLQLFAGPVDDARGKLGAMCREVSDALGLQPGDVVATHVVVDLTVVPHHDGAAWPVVVVHGSERTPPQMRDACDRLRALVASWYPDEDVTTWVTWPRPRT